MVTFSRMEKVSAGDAFSEQSKAPRSLLSREHHYPNVDAQAKSNASLHWHLSSPMNLNSGLGSEYTKQPSYYKERHPIALQDESSLFSSSLSDLFSQKLRLSRSKSAFLQPASNGNSQNAIEHVEETDAHTIKNLLPDEEELFSGVIDCVGTVMTTDESEDFDLFSSGGGIELEADDCKLTSSGNKDFATHITNRWNTNNRVAAANHPTNFLSDRIAKGSSTCETIRVDNSFRAPTVNNQFNSCHPGNGSLGLMNSDTQYIGNLHPHSLPEIHNSIPNAVPWNSLESMVDFVGESPQMTRDINRDLSLRARSLNGGGFGYSSNGFNIPQGLPCTPESFEQQPRRSVAWANSSSSSFMDTTSSHVFSPVELSGFPASPYTMLNSVSPAHLGIHIGSAPVHNASSPLLNRGGESFEELSLRLNPVQNFASIPNQSPSHQPLDYLSLPRAGMELSNSGGFHLSQEMARMFHGRSPSLSTPNSFGFPNERLRSRASFHHPSEKKTFELNIDRILRGEDGRTTLMIKNIPNKYTSKMLLATIDEHHKGKYDFIYLPIDFKNKCNVGYAFINMIDPLHIVSFYKTFNGKKWEKFNSEKVATLAYGRIQGKAALIAHFRNSSLMNEDKRCRPIIFHTDGPNAGDQEPFPTGSNPRIRPGSGTGRLQNE